jgi:hypothetical protein
MDFVLQRSSLRLLAALLFFCVSPAFAAPKEDLGVSLAFAAAAGEPEEVKALLERGAQPDASRNSAGVPALSLAAQRKDDKMPAVIDVLLERDANIEIADKNGQTPLFYAARAGNEAGVKHLLLKGADFYHADNNKLTARDAANEAGRKEIITVMDEHVRAKTSDVLKQYEARNKELETRNEQIAERDRELKERDKEIERQHHEIKERFARKAAEERAAKQAAEKRAAAAQKGTQAADVKRVQDKGKKLDTDKLEETIYALSYHVCAAEYWKFLRKAKQDTGMTRAELKIMQEAHETLVEEALGTMRGEFHAGDPYLAKIVHPTIKEINDVMKIHATNANRKLEGIGTKKDLEERCEDIADQWELVGKGYNIAPPAPPQKNPPKRPRANR